jgi:hypothetical protein
MRYLRDILNALRAGGRVLCRGGVSLHGSSVRGTWRGGSLLGTPQVMKGRLYGREPLYMGALLGQPGVGSSTVTSRCGCGGSGDGVSLSVGALRREPGGGSFPGTLKDI